VPERRWYQGRIRLLAGLFSGLFLLGAYSFYPDTESNVVAISPVISESKFVKVQLPEIPEIELETLDTLQPEPDKVETVNLATKPEPEPFPWQKVTVKKGQNLSIIFDQLGLGPAVLYQVMSAGEQTRMLKNLLPGNSLDFLIKDGQLQALKFEPDLTRGLEVVKQEQGFSSEIVVTELERRTNESHGSIDSSLFIAGQRAGLSDNLIMQLVSIFGWDIDFALDIRKGDTFSVIYEEKFKDKVKVGEGPILAAEFINQDQSYRSVRYTAPDGETNYFNQDGVSMRKAFLRTPLNFSRISSRFNLSRKHPVLNRIRAHKGVDYAAPTGTPIKAAGDGTVVLAGTNGGYGKTVILKHGGNRSTLYAHMSSFSKKMRRGKKVKQGQIIGYVGKSGLATGPHLHYEFRVHGVHRNPLTVKLPKASGVPEKYLANFKQQTAALLAHLDNSSDTRLAQRKSDDSSSNNILALGGETNSDSHNLQ
jgi:murein DD-endopeptidase MepM/ murein hydrolase activator NlpD